MYKFLFYKLYRFAKAQEQTVPPNFGFVALATIFELLHFAIIAVFFKIVGLEINLISKEVFVALIFIFGFSINYFLFIKSKLIYRINEEYQKQNRTVWKDNVLFFSYIIFIYLVMLLEVWVYQNYNV
ncbi:hypothetical protein [Avrilella dinanensis]|uniref:Uncharacterized protein n=1 Tax=Avrilella dinanensis TaxID=2008672 RepID=A0A2M9R649_9FLAO|nr:hypothetical protein [Avrilella dinanensis]PJR04320.1 hypothetical protein CDL10_07070 [Avrilella dinanensis]